MKKIVIALGIIVLILFAGLISWVFSPEDTSMAVPTDTPGLIITE